MTRKSETIVVGTIVEEQPELTLDQVCRVCAAEAEHIVSLVEAGILEARGDNPRQWRFSSVSLGRARCALRLRNDLEINTAGVAVVLDLLDQIDELRARLRRLSS
ncbi:MAG: MerR family transcriptional regulator [Xanthomonadales bacterium]|nr:MerR family transcriptional regulator [Xanthomonadales bacterium]